MKTKASLLESNQHGTPLLPLGIHRLHYSGQDDIFFYLHWHSEVEFFIVSKGAVIYTIEDREMILHEQEGVFVNSNVLHMARSYQGQDCECAAIVFQTTLLIDHVNSPAYGKFIFPVLMGNRIFCEYFQKNIDWHQQVVQHVDNICNLDNEQVQQRELWVRSELLQIWDLCYQNPKERISKDAIARKNYKLKRMEPVLTYIHEHYEEEISLKTLSDMIPMSEGQFCRSFKEITHMSPITYIVHYRVLKSCLFLEETDGKIGEIAQRVGFNNVSYYNREFLRVIGCSPSVYRKNSH